MALATSLKAALVALNSSMAVCLSVVAPVSADSSAVVLAAVFATQYWEYHATYSVVYQESAHKRIGLAERLRTHNTLHWHWTGDGDQAAAATCQVYLSSVNGAAETGELINIDGNGNRVASSLYGHKKVWFIVGRNKLAPTYEEALWRARNIAAPKNAQRLGRKTPCAVHGDRCYDCKSPERICRGLVVLWEAVANMEMEVVLIDQDLGY